TTSPNETVNGSPICAAKLFERFLCRRRFALCLQHHAPMRRGKSRPAVMSISANRAQRRQVVLSGGHMTIELRSHVRFKPVSRRDLMGNVSRDVVFRSAGTARLKRVTANQISHEVI